MTLGNFKRFDEIFMDGALVGYTESSEDFRVGKHCTGTTYNGVTVGRMVLEPGKLDSPTADITLMQEGRHSIYVNGIATLADWEKLLADLLDHVKTLNK